MTEQEKTPPILINLPDELVGDRVVVRPYRAGDGPALFEAVEESREHILPWLPWGPNHKTPEDSEAVIRKALANWITREDMMVGVWERESGRYLGGSGLHRINWDVPSFEIGYWVRRTAEGHGFISEAVRLMCGLTFDTLHANRVRIQCATANVRSAAIPKRLGFVHEGTLRNAGVDTAGELIDIQVFAMTPADYAEASWRMSS